MSDDPEAPQSPAEKSDWERAFDNADAIRARQENAYPQRLWDQLDRIEVAVQALVDAFIKESGSGKQPDHVPEVPGAVPAVHGGGPRGGARKD